MTLHSVHALGVMAREREAQLRRAATIVGRTRPRRHVRRWLGRRLVHVGVWLAAEPMLRRAPAR